MKRCNLLPGLCLAALPAAALAQPAAGPYISLGAGVDFLQDESLEPYDGSRPVKRAYTFNPGAAVAVSGGYRLGNGLRVELEGDYANNHVRGVQLNIPERAGGHEQQFGGFANALYDLPLRLPVQPYVGLGAGYQEIELDGVNSGDYGRSANGRGAEDEGNFAYQAIAGVSYPLVRGLSLTAEYRFIGVLSPDPYARGVFRINDIEEPARATINNIFNHEIMVGLRYDFGTPPPPTVAAAQPVPVTAPAPAAARTYLIFFDWDRADLTDRARQIIAAAAQASTQTAATRLEVDGYTDSSGLPTYNQALSLRRAHAAAAELVRDGVPEAVITIEGFGERNPLVPTAAGVREPQNRRVEIILR